MRRDSTHRAHAAPRPRLGPNCSHGKHGPTNCTGCACTCHPVETRASHGALVTKPAGTLRALRDQHRRDRAA